MPRHAEVVLDRTMRTRDMDNERFLLKVRARLDAYAAPAARAPFPLFFPASRRASYLHPRSGSHPGDHAGR